MARTKQTARKSTGGKAPRKQMATKAAGRFRAYMTSQQTVGTASFGSASEQKERTSFINYENTLGEFKFSCGKSETTKSFVPRFTLGAGKDATTGNDEQWLAVNFHSCYDNAGMNRKGRPPIDIAFVLDISGSMSCAFDDNDDGGGFSWSPKPGKAKLDVAKKCIKAIFSQLQPQDNVGIILFNQQAHELIPLQRCEGLNRRNLEKKIDDVCSAGGTNLSNGFDAGMTMLRDGPKETTTATTKTKKWAKGKADDTSSRLKRVLFLTDMQSSPSDESAVLATAKSNASTGLHTTVCGIGVDLSVGTVQQLSKIAGCKYTSVASATEFVESVAAEFDYDVTPIAYDIGITLTAPRSFQKGYGSPELNDVKAGAKTVKLSSEFPVLANIAGEVPGILCFKLNSTLTPKEPINIVVKWTNMEGNKETHKTQLSFDDPQHMSTDVRKAIALIRYVDLQSEYVLDDKDDDDEDEPQQQQQQQQRFHLQQRRRQQQQPQPRRRGNSKAPSSSPSPYLAAMSPVVEETPEAKANPLKLDEKKSRHGAWLKRFKELREFLLLELNACGDNSVDGEKAMNRNVLDTIDQIIGFEEKSLNDVEKMLTTAAAVEADEQATTVTGDMDFSSSAPNEYLCPITNTLMVDPVVATDGQTYEKTSIEKWFKTQSGRVKSAVTNTFIKSRDLVPNLSLRKLIQDFVTKKTAETTPTTTATTSTTTTTTSNGSNNTNANAMVVDTPPSTTSSSTITPSTSTTITTPSTSLTSTTTTTSSTSTTSTTPRRRSSRVSTRMSTPKPATTTPKPRANTTKLKSVGKAGKAGKAPLKTTTTINKRKPRTTTPTPTRRTRTSGTK